MEEKGEDGEEGCFTLNKKILLPVADQGNSQTCYAYVTTGCVSSLFAAKGLPLVRLAVQELVDKLKSPKNYNNGFLYIKKQGISLEACYCTGEQGSEDTKVRISDFHKLNPLNYKDIDQKIKYQPLAGAIEVYTSFREFKGKGIYMGPEPGEETIGPHAVQVVGFGVENGIKYYRILNSWGTKWGDNGIAKVKRDLITRLSYPSVESKELELARDVFSKSASNDQEDSSNRKGKNILSISEKDSDKSMSSSSKRKGYSKTRKTTGRRD